jgi:hypothetical protein
MSYQTSLWSKRFFQTGKKRKSGRGPGRGNRLRIEGLEERRLLTATLMTDKLDYQPGEWAILTASGFQVGETIQFQVLHIDGTPNTGNGHDAWYVEDGGPDDLDGVEDGNVVTQWYVDPDDSLYSTFEATALGLSSNLSASTVFTDQLNDGTWTIRPLDADKAEGDSDQTAFTFEITFVRTPGPPHPAVAVDYTVTTPAGGTAVGGTTCDSGIDYINTGGTVQFAGSADAEGSQVITVFVCGDTVIEPDEEFVVTLTNPSNSSLGSPSQASGWIRNDDEEERGEVIIGVSPECVLEDAGQDLVYTFTRSGSTAAELTVQFSISGTATLGTDYSISGATLAGDDWTVTFGANQTQVQVTVTPIADKTVELDEDITFTLLPDGYDIGASSSATGIIRDDDLARTLVLGADANRRVQPWVHVVYVNDGAEKTESLVSFKPYADNFRTGVRVVVADMDGDGIPDIVVAPGRGKDQRILVFKLDGTPMPEYTTKAYPAKMNHGIQIAVGDVNNDGLNDLVTVPSRGPAQVKVFFNQTVANPGPHADPAVKIPDKDFTVDFGNKKFKGGAVLAVGDFGTMGNPGFSSELDGNGEIVIGSSAGMGAKIEIYDVTGDPTLVRTFAPFQDLGPKFRGGVASIALWDANGDGIPDLVVGAGNGGSSRVEVLNGANGAVLAWTNAYPSIPRQRQAPVRVTVRSEASCEDREEGENGIDSRIAVWTAQGSDGKTSQPKRFNLSLEELDSVFEASGDFRGEYFIA